MEKLKIGLVGTSQLSFPGDKDTAYAKCVSGLEKLAAEYGFGLAVYRETVITPDDAAKANAFFDEEKIDFLLIQHTSYSSGYLADAFARQSVKKNFRLGLWAIPEGADSGVVPFNSMCSINMHQAIIYHYFRDLGIKVKWFYGYAEDERFRRRLCVTVRALTALKNMNRSRLALVGGIAPGFNDLYNDERQFYRLFPGFSYDRLVEYDELKKMALAVPEKDAEAKAKEMLACSCGIIDSAKPVLTMSARFYLAYKRFVEDNGYDAVAISCWPKFFNDFGYSVCSVIGQLNDEGTVAACEGDVLSAISMLALRYMTDDVTMLMDMTKFDESDNSVLMWHCGPAGSRFGRKYTLGCNYSGTDQIKGQPPIGLGVARDMVFDPMSATSFRISGECDRYMLLTGDFMGDVKPSMTGSRGWMNNLRLNGSEISALDLINTIQTVGFQHHYPIAAGNIEAIVKEFCAWIGIRPINRIGYEDCLQTAD